MSQNPKAQEYLNFNFADNDNWKAYLNKLDPVPEGKLLEKKKRIWYRNNIDPEFNVFFDSDDPKSSNTNEPSPENNPNTGNNPIPNTNTQPQMSVSDKVKEDIFQMEGYFKLGFFLAFIIPLIPKQLAHIAGLIGCLLGLVRQNCSFPSLKAFVKKLLGNEFLSNLLYIVCVWVLEEKEGALFMLPIFLHFTIGASEYITRNPTKFDFIIKIAQASYLMNIVKTYRMTVMENKCRVELFIGLYLAALCAFGQANIINISLYVIFLVFKVLFNDTMRLTLKNIQKIFF